MSSVFSTVGGMVPFPDTATIRSSTDNSMAQNLSVAEYFKPIHFALLGTSLNPPHCTPPDIQLEGAPS